MYEANFEFPERQPIEVNFIVKVIPDKTSLLINDSGYITNSSLIPLQSDILDLQNDKVDKVVGKGLSTNDFTDADKSKLDGIEAGAQVNTVNSVNGQTGDVVIDIPDSVTWGNITGTLANQYDLLQALNAKQDTISDLSDIRAGAEAGATALQPDDVINNTSSSDMDKPLSAAMGLSLQNQVDNLSARGRFLALWNSATGLAQSNPSESPYLYKSGDYFIVGTVGTTNYRPTGSSYTTGVASTVVETDTVDIDDVYYYDGENWRLQVNTQKTISFVHIAGDPYDNTNLASALNAKQDELAEGTGIDITNNTISNSGVRAVSTGATNGTILVNTGGTSSEVSVYGLGTSAYTSSTDYATAAQGTLANSAVQDVKVNGSSVVVNKVANIAIDDANKDLSNLSTDGNNRLHALKSYEDAGELLTDAEGLADVTKYAHSTFDLSKFTKVGTPNITDDGVFIPTTSSSSTPTGYVTFPADNTVNKIKVKVRIVAENSVARYHAIIGDATAYFYLRWNNSENNQCSFSGSGFSEVSLNIAFKQGNTYDLIYERESLNVKYTVVNVTTGESVYATTTLSEMPVTTITSLSKNWQADNYHGYVYDLKHCSVEVDGVPVFSGNKTGIDTIKPDDYTVVGTPTISADGIVSGLSLNTNYVGTNTFTDLSTANNWDIEFEFKINSLSNLQYILCSVNSNTLYNLGFFIRTNGKLAWGVFTDNGSTQVVKRDTAFNFTTNTVYRCKLSFTGTAYNFYIWNGTSWDLDTSSISSTTKVGPVTQLYFGAGMPSVFSGSIDLNAFKIYVDGNLVYQPCLKIPYTQSKTGSKVVDSVNRDRVNDMYEQFGYAPYYTLNEGVNFTVPQGEIYGLIGKVESNMQTTTNLVTSVSSASTDLQYPSAKLFYDTCGDIETLINAL